MDDKFLRSETSIKTKRLFMRQIDETDASAIVSLRSDENVYKFFLNPIKLTVEDHLSWYHNSYCNNTNRIDWVAVTDNGGEFIGVYGANREQDNTVELSYITNPKQLHRGYASEAVKAIIDWCTEKWETTSYKVTIHKGNEVSIGFAHKLGFVKAEDVDDAFICMKLDVSK